MNGEGDRQVQLSYNLFLNFTELDQILNGTMCTVGHRPVDRCDCSACGCWVDSRGEEATVWGAILGSWSCNWAQIHKLNTLQPFVTQHTILRTAFDNVMLQEVWNPQQLNCRESGIIEKRQSYHVRRISHLPPMDEMRPAGGFPFRL